MLKKASILIVEDDPVSQELLKMLLDKTEWMVFIVSDGLAAVEATDSIIFDLIFMDIHLPKMDGFQAARIIKEKYNLINRNVPIIAVTASTIEGIKENSLRQGMDDYISKPVNSAAIQSVALKYLKNKQSYLPKSKSS